MIGKVVAQVLLATAVVGCSSDPADDQAGAPVALVTLATAQRGVLEREATIYGAAEPSAIARVTLTAPVEGTLIGIVAVPGTPVRQGQAIALLAPSATTKLDLAKAQSDAQAADLALSRARRLRSDGLGSDADVQTALAAARAAGLLRDSLADRIRRLVIRASAAGIVDTVAPTLGDPVAGGAAVATITRPAAPRARFGVAPELAAGIRAGAPLRIRTGPDRAITVPVASVGNTVDPQTRLVPLFARLPTDSGVSAGQTLTATVAIGNAATVAQITVPYAALLDEGGQSYVFVVTHGAAHRRDVTTGAAQGERVAIVRGVTTGDRVVVAGGTAVTDGMKVRTR